jgi:hypothetical protein
MAQRLMRSAQLVKLVLGKYDELQLSEKFTCKSYEWTWKGVEENGSARACVLPLLLKIEIGVAL